ncbi:hypothetical protein CNR22_20975 [Sphingobacteriaceae bacterium]|nr:hypothetical protein CNR22_20975 [Sphingobacteriaceae bacterium]
MLKTILIPTDFTVESLTILHQAVEENAIFDLSVILLHGHLLNDSITDLLFYSDDSVIKPQLTPEFSEAILIFKERYREIKSISIDVTHSIQQEPFNRLLKTKKVDEIYLELGYSLRLSKKAFDTLPLLKESGFPISEFVPKERLSQNIINPDKTKSNYVTR